ncbi:MAG: HNH endonuclease [Polyangiaceae bacterium]|nr:HNH endonuclease [Polyangiaceae bacterium]
MFDPTLKARFWSRVDRRGPEECWPWLARVKQDGYGLVDVDVDGKRTTTVVNRVAWELTRGEIPEGLLVCHHCDNPRCCNPSHLFLGTNADNHWDMRRKGRAGWQRARRREDDLSLLLFGDHGPAR